MSVSEIDVIQTAQIEDLQDDVKELRDKLNILVSDITDVDGVDGATRDGLTKKLNDAIDDADNLNTIINAGYSVGTGGGSSSVGILKRLDELFQDLENHKWVPTSGSTPTAGSYIETHPPDHTSGSVISGAGTSVSNLSGTAQGNDNARSLYTATAVASTILDPDYTTDVETNILTLKSVGEKRARKLARKIQGQITEEDRANTNVK